MECLEQYFEAIRIEDDKKHAILLTVCGSKTYSLIRNTVVSAKPKDKSYEKFVQLVKEHVCPAPLVITERFKLHQANHWDEERVIDYICALRILAETSSFFENLWNRLYETIKCVNYSHKAFKRSC